MLVHHTALASLRVSLVILISNKIGSLLSCSDSCDCGVLPSTNQSMTGLSASCKYFSSINVSNVVASLPLNITCLSIRDSQLASIAQICDFIELVQLDVSFNAILTVLAYDAYAVFPKMEYLNVAYNRISALRREEFVSFPNVKDLDLSFNQIASIQEETFRLLSLRHLNLRSNEILRISERMFRYTPLLIDLDLSLNNMTRLYDRNFFYLQGIRRLNLSGNQIENVDRQAFLPLYKLKLLDLSYNLITKFPKQQLMLTPELSVLNFSSNSVEFLSQGDISNLSLRCLYMNDMAFLRAVLRHAIVNLTRLTTIHITNSKQFCYISGDAFQNVPNLTNLVLSGNNLIAINEKLLKQESIITVDIRKNPLSCDNRITENDAVEKLRDIVNLRCFHGGLAMSYNSRNSARMNKTPNLPLCHGDITVPIVAQLGTVLRLYCMVVGPAYGRTVWKHPEPRNVSHYKITNEYLEISIVTSEDSGVFSCASATDAARRQVSFGVRVLAPDVHIVATLIGDDYVIVEWNVSSIFADMNNFMLSCERSYPDANERLHEKTRMGKLFRNHRFIALKPGTNYTICVLYKPHDVIMDRHCIEIQTRQKPLESGGLIIDHQFASALVVFSGIVLLTCLLRCGYARWTVWRRGKWHNRMQESFSTQGFMSSSESLNPCSARVLTTYENFQTEVPSLVHGSAEETTALVHYASCDEPGTSGTATMNNQNPRNDIQKDTFELHSACDL